MSDELGDAFSRLLNDRAALIWLLSAAIWLGNAVAHADWIYAWVAVLTVVTACYGSGYRHWKSQAKTAETARRRP